MTAGRFVLCTAAILFCAVVQAGAQLRAPSVITTLGDTLSETTIYDMIVDSDGTVFVTGDVVRSIVGDLFIAAVSPSGDTLFTRTFHYGFQSRGLFIRPAGPGHLVVAGFNEDQTGTFNIRLLTLTTSGTVVWDTSYGFGDGKMQEPRDVEIDQWGNIIIGSADHFSEIPYLLVKFSPSGELLWAKTGFPFQTGTFAVTDVAVDASGNIYGTIDNSFISDTSHGSVIKWDPSGTVMWQRDFNISFRESFGRHLLFAGDTVIIAGIPWTNGVNPASVTVAALSGNGDLLSFTRIPFSSGVQGIRALNRLSGGITLVAAETFRTPLHLLHVMGVDASGAVVYRDSVTGTSSMDAVITPRTPVMADMVIFGGLCVKRRYLRSGSGIASTDIMQADLGGRTVDKAADAGSHLSTASRTRGGDWETVTLMTFPALPSTVRRNPVVSPKEITLHPPFPNPFNPATVLSFSLPERSKISVTIHDVVGRSVATLVSDVMDAGTHTLQWNADGCASGTYFIRLQTSRAVRTAAVLLLH